MGAEELETALNRATGASGASRMWFTSRAKRALFFDATDEARALGYDCVGGEHILLALLGESQGQAARVLDSCGVTVERVRERVGQMGGSGVEPSGRLDRNAEAIGVDGAAQTEAEALGHEQVGTAHVLLALLGYRDGVALGVVRDLGGEPQAIRGRVLAEIEAGHGDYEGFSVAAREVVALAEHEARRLDHGQVGTEHLLLALLRDQHSVAFRVLESLGITSGETREAVTGTTGGADGAPSGPIALAEHARQVLELAGEEARSSGGPVNPEHVLLGLARRGEGLGARILFARAGGPDAIRVAVVREVSRVTGQSGSGFFERFTARAAEVVVLAQEEARVLGHGHIGSEHLLLGLLREQGDAAGAGLDALGLAVDRVRQQVAASVGQAEETSASLLPFAVSARKVFELALDDARWLEHDDVGTEHIALGLARETEHVGARLMQALDIHPDLLRAQALRALGAHWASELPAGQEQLSRQEQRLRGAQRRYDEADTDKEREMREAFVVISQRQVDRARGDVLPERCREALGVLVDYATEEWLNAQPPAEDSDRRQWYRRHCATNIDAQLLDALFHPGLGPEANPINGHPGGPDAPNPRRRATGFTLS